MDKISIIVPIYNSDKTIKECIASITSQKYENIEIILINDGSNDNSLMIIQEEAKNDRRIHVINQENKGVSFARNIGVSYASSKWVLFVDSDDVLYPNAVEILSNNRTSSSKSIVIAGYEKEFDSDSKLTQRFCYENSVISIKEFMEQIDYYLGLPILQSPCWKLFNVELIKKNSISFPENMSFGEDFSFVIDYISRIEELSIVNEVIYTYKTSNSESLTRITRNDKYQINNNLLNKIRLISPDDDKTNQTIIRVKMLQYYNDTIEMLESFTLKSSEKYEIYRLNSKLMRKDIGELRNFKFNIKVFLFISLIRPTRISYICACIYVIIRSWRKK